MLDINQEYFEGHEIGMISVFILIIELNFIEILLRIIVCFYFDHRIKGVESTLANMGTAIVYDYKGKLFCEWFK
jgi:hypothetical protein